MLALTRDGVARRINQFEPEQSLVLLKTTTQIPHEGGQRFDKNSEEYKVLRQWIAEGARSDASGTPTLTKIEISPGEMVLVEPADHLQIKASAIFSDGSKRDITSLAVYEPAN